MMGGLASNQDKLRPYGPVNPSTDFSSKQYFGFNEQHYLTFPEDQYHHSSNYGQNSSQSIDSDKNYPRDYLHIVHARTVIAAFLAAFTAPHAFKLIIIRTPQSFLLLVVLLLNNAAVERFCVGIGVRKVITWFASAAIAASFEALVGNGFTLK